MRPVGAELFHADGQTLRSQHLRFAIFQTLLKVLLPKNSFVVSSFVELSLLVIS
jgi:hypothetical protein